MKSKVLVIGASEKLDRYANKAIRMLRDHDHEVVAIGSRPGTILDVEFGTDKIDWQDIDTVTLYLSSKYQSEYYTYLIDYIKPRRIIFNPGTENQELIDLATKQNIACEEACTLVLLSTGQF
ncbi:MAG: putative CoA-binding protein [Lentimonas sp.]|jgi:predicted CoA-binding protein